MRTMVLKSMHTMVLKSMLTFSNYSLRSRNCLSHHQSQITSISRCLMTGIATLTIRPALRVLVTVDLLLFHFKLDRYFVPTGRLAGASQEGGDTFGTHP